MADVTTPRPIPLDRRRSPLQDYAEELAAGSNEAMSLREIPFLVQVGLRAEPGSDTAAAFAAVLGADLPAPGKAASYGGGRTVLWLGPDEFLLIAPEETESGISPAAVTAEFTSVLTGLPGQAVDLSANRTTLELKGAAVEDVLNSAIRIDLEERSFPVGDARATLLGKTPIILWRTASDTIRLLPRASFAVHVARWLLDAMREHAA